MNILVPFNFSSSSLNALRFGIKQVLDSGSSLKVLHCFDLQLPSFDLTYTVDVASTKKYKDGISTEFEALREEFPEIADVQWDFEVREGFLVDVAREVIENENIDLIVMGMGDSGGITKTLFGNTTLEMMNSTKLPIIAIPKDFKEFEIKNICIATDMAPDSVEDLDMARHFSAMYNAKVHLLNIGGDPKEIDIDHSLVALGLHDFLKGIAHEFHFLSDEKIDRTIEAFVKEFKIDMLVIRPGSHGLIGKLFSHTRKLLAYQTIPLMTIHK